MIEKMTCNISLIKIPKNKYGELKFGGQSTPCWNRGSRSSPIHYGLEGIQFMAEISLKKS
jgi:hypothetical protein